jgi:hypothetical protein
METCILVLAAAGIVLSGYALGCWLSRPDPVRLEAELGMRQIEAYLRDRAPA